MENLSGKRTGGGTQRYRGDSHDPGAARRYATAVDRHGSPLRVAKGSRNTTAGAFRLALLGMELAAGGNGRTGSANRWASERAWPWQQGPHTAAGNQRGPFAHGSSDLRTIDPLRGA